jgi:polyketide biosynthesis 3-hydroxy-3-methylglutaryl-CoA synthase-like enzyme PksG
MRAGIEDIQLYPGRAFLDIPKLAQARGLDSVRMQNLLMSQKTVALHFEDPVSFAVNAAKPIVDRLAAEEKNRIELLIVATESGLDFGKPISTYIHHHLGLSRNCRTFEAKHACYGGTAALQMAAGFIHSETSPGAKALVITTDTARPIPHTYAEPSQGAAAIAMLVSGSPAVLELEKGASGYYGYEVMDSCRPTPEIETGDADLSLLSYLDCIENSCLAYSRKVGEVDFATYFDYFAFHTPFGGMAKGAHRSLLRKLKRMPPAAIEEDFHRRLEPSLCFCRRVGNIYSGTVFLALAGVLQFGSFASRKRIGLFSYGSGCCSEFYSGLADAHSQQTIAARQFGRLLDERQELDMREYDHLLELQGKLPFGTRSAEVDFTIFPEVHRSRFAGRGLLLFRGIDNYHREYTWS